VRYSTDSNPSTIPNLGRSPITLFWEKWRRGVISAFIIFNIVAISFGSTAPVSQQGPVERFFTPYLVWTRLLQNWRLFVPTPKKFFMNYHAEITFKDGTKKNWQRPYPPNWDFFPRHLAYQFQKWDLASNYLEQPGLSSLLWEDLGSYLTRIYNDPANPPEKIEFFRSRADIPPPLETGYAQPDLSQLQWQTQLVHTYTVQDRSKP
jgi:hypothetical protein